ncbi:hypothetical protein GCM10010832_21630 [Psychroflexus planctonicus]|uniref:Secretion system C-terminal sorting domain-containing protein n=2 Tax=Psychroflexus planctonicus TaxID=1526575 RepID=A0ABQ1SKR8_9FLAO|nr:hypothetical protein GCM10010832_21630 [Psychroflexus planctonicus]
MLIGFTTAKANHLATEDYNYNVTLENEIFNLEEQSEANWQALAVDQIQEPTLEDTKKMNVLLYREDSYNAGSTSSDAIEIRFTINGFNGLDDRDAPKMNNVDENLARIQDGELLVLENRAFPEADENLQLFMNQFSTTNYVLKFILPEFEDVKLKLVDNYTNVSHDLPTGESTVNFVLDNSNASQAYNRFSLVFEPITLSTVNYANKAKVSLYPNPVKSNYFYVEVPSNSNADVLVEIFNAQGRKVKTQVFKNQTSNTIKVDNLNLTQGVYYFKIQGKHNLNVTKKFIKS